MKVLTLYGGPRKKGNTATIAGWVEEELTRLGHTVTRVNLMTQNVQGCIGCLKCKDQPDKPGCILQDDGLPLIDLMIAGDAVIFASPLYYWGVSALMKAFIDRCHCLYRGTCGGPDHTSFVANQRQALIATAADPFENNAELLLTTFQRLLVYNRAHSAGELLVCNCTEPDALDETIKTQAILFARQLFNSHPKPYALLFPAGAPNMVPKV